MTAWEIFYQGRYFARRNKKLWFVLWLVNALLATLAALPVFNLLSSELDHSLMAAAMFGRFNLDFASDIIYKYFDLGPFIGGMTLALGVVYVVFTVLTTGGTLSVFAGTGRQFRAPVFFRGCGMFFWRFFRLLILALIFYAIFVLGLNAAMTAFLRWLTENWGQEKYVLLLTWARWVAVAFVFLVLNMIFDYAKVRLVVDEGRSAIGAAFRSIQFVFRNFRKTLGVYLFCVLLGLIIMAIYNPLEHVLPQQTKRWIIAVFFLQQLFILARVYVRLTFFSSEVILYESLKPVSVPESPVVSALSITSPEAPSSLGDDSISPVI